MQKLLKKLGLLTVIISFSSCGHNLPTKPSLDSGIVIAELNEIFFVNNQTSEERYEPIIIEGCQVNPNINKNIVHSNKDWNKVLLYIRLLENYTPKRVDRQLRKVRKSFTKLNERVKAHGL